MDVAAPDSLLKDGSGPYILATGLFSQVLVFDASHPDRLDQTMEIPTPSANSRVIPFTTSDGIGRFIVGGNDAAQIRIFSCLSPMATPTVLPSPDGGGSQMEGCQFGFEPAQEPCFDPQQLMISRIEPEPIRRRRPGKVYVWTESSPEEVQFEHTEFTPAPLRIHRVEGGTGTTSSLLFACGSDSDDGGGSLIRQYDLSRSDPDCCVSFEGHTSEAYDLACHDQTLMSAAADNTIRVWDVRTREQVSIVYCAQVLNSMYWDPDSHAVLVGMYPGTICHLDDRRMDGNDAIVNSFRVHVRGESYVYDMTKLVDGVFVSVSWDRTVVVWTLEGEARCRAVAPNEVYGVAVVGGSD